MSNSYAPVLTFGALKKIIEDMEASGTADTDVVIIAKDSMGDAFSPLASWSNDGVYAPANTWSGTVEEWDEEAEYEKDIPDRQTYDQWRADRLAASDAVVPCVTLWPMH